MTRLVPRAREEHMRVSVIVPCSHKHVRLLPELIEHLGAQTRKADEIVVAVSGCEAPAVPATSARILYSSVPQTCGQNRNRASEAAVGDVLIYQDADDLPHPQRVEIIAGLFEVYEIEHLMHGYIYTRGSRWSVGFPSGTNKNFDGRIEMPSSSIEEAAARCAYRSEPAPSTRVTNGEIAVARFVFDAVCWPERGGTGTDMEFNKTVYARFKRTAATELPLVIYRHDFSAFR